MENTVEVRADSEEEIGQPASGGTPPLYLPSKPLPTEAERAAVRASVAELRRLLAEDGIDPEEIIEEFDRGRRKNRERGR